MWSTVNVLSDASWLAGMWSTMVCDMTFWKVYCGPSKRDESDTALEVTVTRELVKNYNISLVGWGHLASHTTQCVPR